MWMSPKFEEVIFIDTSLIRFSTFVKLMDAQVGNPSTSNNYTNHHQPSTAVAGKHGHHGHGASGTACIVKGSSCWCHYCKCEKGHVHCHGHGHHGHGKKFCYGKMEGQYCHCDFCSCKKGYGKKGYGKCH